MNPIAHTVPLFVRHAIVIACLLGVVGCSGGPRSTTGGKIAVGSITQKDATATSGFQHGIYSFKDQNTITAVLYDGPVDNPSQVLVIRMLWKPRAAKTPISADATNASIRYITFSGEGNREVGIYGGGGFMYPKSKLGRQSTSASVWDATLKLTEHSAGFEDKLGLATVSGDFSANRDDEGTEAAIGRINAMVRERLGR